MGGPREVSGKCEICFPTNCPFIPTETLCEKHYMEFLEAIDKDESFPAENISTQ